MDIKSVSAAYGAMVYDSTAKSGKKAETAKPVVGSSAVVAISDESLNLKKVKDAVYSAPDIRLPIVEKIRERIANNSYPVDLKAQSALDEMLKLKIL
jgi:anti-sigma28 factor (negative regulator of flagellin synthesis)